LKSVQLDPATTEAYADLATLYMEQNKESAALKILEQGLTENPFSVDLMAEQAMIYISKGDLSKAEGLVSDAEEIDSDSEIILMIRQVLEAQKEQQRQQQRQQQRSASNKKSNKSKKRR
jgi:Tfp pilus assembly protein PilF